MKFRATSLNTANQIQAGLQPTDEELKVAQQEEQANQQKIAAQEKQLQAQEQQTLANQEQIQKTQAEQAALSKRFGELGDYDVKATATVYFAVNSHTVNAKGQQDLQALAARATPHHPNPKHELPATLGTCPVIAGLWSAVACYRFPPGQFASRNVCGKAKPRVGSGQIVAGLVVALLCCCGLGLA